MMTSDDRNARIRTIDALPDRLETAVRGLSDAQIDTPYRAGGWTVRQVVHHLADSHMNAFLRMKWMLTEDHPVIKTYDQDVWAQSPEYALPLASSLSLIRGLHARWTSLLASIPENDWTARTAEHPERGEVTLEQMLEIYSGHGEKHCDQIMNLRNAMHWM